MGYGGFGLWTGSKVVVVSTHRLAYEMAFGPIPEGMCVCHLCDQPRCVLPAHLFLGTVKENNADRDTKGRGWIGRGDEHWSKSKPERIPRGERQRKAKLTDAIVRELRRRSALGETHASMSRELGVHIGTVGRVVSRRTWAHVE